MEWGPAPPDWQFWQAAPASRPPIDRLAIATLVTGGLGGAFLPVVFGAMSFILGAASLRRIRAGERRGMGFVLTGWALCLAGVAVGIGFATYQNVTQPARNPDGAVTAAGQVMPLDLLVGDCVKLPSATEGIVRTVVVTDCAQPHNSQVIAILKADFTTYPGDDALTNHALDECSAEATTFLGTEDSRLRVITFVAPEAEWNRGEHSEICLLADMRSDFTGDVRQHP